MCFVLPPAAQWQLTMATSAACTTNSLRISDVTMTHTRTRSHLALTRTCILVTLLIAACFPTGTLGDNQHEATTNLSIIDIRYPTFDIEVLPRVNEYRFSLLKLAMDKSGYRYKITLVPVNFLSGHRSQKYLEDNQFNIYWLNTTKERESKLIPVRIPLLKGLIGWRLLLINPASEQKFIAIQQAEDLRALVATQGHDWPDVAVFKYNQLPIITSANRNSLFKMLKIGRVDYLPRSILEIFYDKENYAAMHFEIESTLALHYPAAVYFFTNKQHPEIAKALLLGLSRAIADGSFEELFLTYFSEDIQKAALDKRRVIELKKPDLELPNDPQYWYYPATKTDVKN